MLDVGLMLFDKDFEWRTRKQSYFCKYDTKFKVCSDNFFWQNFKIVAAT